MNKYYKIASFILIAGMTCSSLIAQAQYENTNNAHTIDTNIILQFLENSRQYEQSDPDSAAYAAKKAYNYSVAINFKEGVKESLLQVALINFNKNQYHESKSNLEKLFTLCDSVIDKSKLERAYNIEGANNFKLGRYKNAFYSFTNALKYISDTSHKLTTVYNNMGTVFIELGQYEKAIYYFDKSIQKSRGGKLYPSKDLCRAYMEKARSYSLFNKNNLAEVFFDSAIDCNKSIQNYEGILFSLIFKGYFYNKIQKPHLALELISQAKDIYKYNFPSFNRTYLFYLVEGDAYSKINKFKDAINALYTAYSSNEYVSDQDRSSIIHKVYETYFTMGDYKNALYAHMLSHQIIDSITNKAIKSEVSEMEVKYRTAEKDKELALKNLKLTEREKTIAQKNNLLLVIISGILLLLITALWRYRYLKRKQRHQQEISHLKGIIEGEEKERTRLAHELHDGINSQLAAINTYLIAGTKTHPSFKADPNMITAQHLLTDTAEGIRRIAHNLAPESLIAKGLAQSVKDFCSNIFSDGKVQAVTDIYGDYDHLDAQLSLNIYRVIQELVQNIKKHAEASQCTLILLRQEHVIRLTIEDNGKGFDKANPPYSKGIGLVSLQERVKASGGTFEITSSSNGTVAEVSFPLKLQQEM